MAGPPMRPPRDRGSRASPAPLWSSSLLLTRSRGRFDLAHRHPDDRASVQENQAIGSEWGPLVDHDGFSTPGFGAMLSTSHVNVTLAREGRDVLEHFGQST